MANGVEILTQCRLPARLDVHQTARLLGFSDHDISVLMRAKLLCPLGKPAPNAPKFFAAVDIEGHSKDRDWLNKATTAIARHWRSSNLKKNPANLTTA